MAIIVVRPVSTALGPRRDLGGGLQRYAADPSVALTVARFSFRRRDESHRRIVSRARGRNDREEDNTTDRLTLDFQGVRALECEISLAPEVSRFKGSDPLKIRQREKLPRTPPRDHRIDR